MKTITLAAMALGLTAAACAPMDNGPEPMPPMDGEADQCMAANAQWLVGQPRSAIPPSAPSGMTWRVTCTTCPVTMDYNPHRLNIFYDQDTGIVQTVKCG